MPQLTGDWFGRRSSMAESGLTLLADTTNFAIGNTTGGVRPDFDFGGHGDYVLIADCGKLGIRDGLSVKLRAEHRFGETIVDDVGCFISPTLIADLPVFGSEQVYLTNVLLTQSLSDSLAVFAGKMDTLDGDMNAFAHGRGKTQFSNMAFVFNPIVGATVPYSTLGTGFVILREGQPLLTFSVLNSTDTTGTSGFSQLFNDGVLLSASLRVPTNVWDMPGHQLIGATWNNQTYTSISEPYIPYPDVPIPTTRGSWCLFWNFDQYLVVDSEEPLHGWGPFGRAGIADDNTSPLAWFLSFGIGGNVPAQSRPDDTFGIGWYYGGTSSQIGPLITAQFGPIGNGQGIECFYNYQWTPAIRLTPDLQFIVPALTSFDPSLIVGLRAQLIF
jgi:porin